MADVPVLTDRTGQQLAKAMLENNALLGDVLQEIRKLNGVVESPVFAVKARVAEKTKDDAGKVTNIKLALDTAGADILSAHEESWPLALWIDDSVDGGKYSIPFYKAKYNENTATPEASTWVFTFVSLTANNPFGRISTYTITHFPTAGFTNTSVDA